MNGAAVRRTTAALAATSLLWLAAVLAAPHALEAAPGTPVRLGAGTIYLAGRVVCHQKPERSFAAAPLAFLLALALPGGAARKLWAWPATRRGLLVAALPAAASVVVEWTTGWTDPGLRAATGAILGFAGAGIVSASLASRPMGAAATLPPPLPSP